MLKRAADLLRHVELLRQTFPSHHSFPSRKKKIPLSPGGKLTLQIAVIAYISTFHFALTTISTSHPPAKLSHRYRVGRSTSWSPQPAARKIQEGNNTPLLALLEDNISTATYGEITLAMELAELNRGRWSWFWGRLWGMRGCLRWFGGAGRFRRWICEG